MDNASIDLYNYYTKELSLFKLAFGNQGTFIKTLFVLSSVLVFIFYITEYESYKALILFGYTLCVGVFFIYLRYRIICKNSKIVGKYDMLYAKMQLSKIFAFLIMDFIYKRGLLDKEGVEYLISICSKKSTRNRFQSIAIGIVLVSAVTQTVTDFLINAEQNDWNRIASYFDYFKANSIFILTIIITSVIFFLMLRFSYNEIKTTIINRKNKNYQQISDFLEGRILPLVLKFCYLKNRDLQYKLIIIDIIGNPSNFNKKDKTINKKIKIKIRKKGNCYKLYL